MPESTSFEIRRSPDGWTLFQSGEAQVTLETPRAAFDKAVFAAVAAIGEGRDVSISLVHGEKPK